MTAPLLPEQVLVRQVLLREMVIIAATKVNMIRILITKVIAALLLVWRTNGRR